jgi:hypothetical protein
VFKKRCENHFPDRGCQGDEDRCYHVCRTRASSLRRGLHWLTAQGIDRDSSSAAQTTGSRESAARVEDFLKRGKSYGGALSNSYKDIRQALETAAALELPLPLMNTVNQLQEMARAQGLTRLNTPAAIGKLYEILTGTDLSDATVESERVFPEPQEPEVIYLGEL